MRVIGIDFSLTNTGIVCIEDGKVTKYLAISTSKSVGSNITLTTDCYFRVTKIVDRLLHEFTLPPNVLVIESPSFHSVGNASVTIPMANGMLVSRLLNYWKNSEFISVTPSQLKKYATGKGNANKEGMLNAMKNRNTSLHEAVSKIPKTKGRYDICDAYFLADFGYNHIDKQKFE